MRRIYARVEHKGCGRYFCQLLASTSPFFLRRYCGMKRLGPTLHVRLRETGSTDLHALGVLGGWRVSVSPTLVGLDSMKRVLMKGK